MHTRAVAGGLGLPGMGRVAHSCSEGRARMSKRLHALSGDALPLLSQVRPLIFMSEAAIHHSPLITGPAIRSDQKCLGSAPGRLYSFPCC